MEVKNRILLADDEEDLTRALGAILNYSGYLVDIVNNGLDAIDKAKHNEYDILILDVMMPGKTGIEVAQELRQENIDVPILMLTAKAETGDKVEGLDAGANDYLTKPFEKEELLARIRAITRANKNQYKKIQIGNVTLNRDSNELTSDKASYNLNTEESKLLETLVSNKKEMSCEELKTKVWNEDANPEIVPMYVSYLQNKLNALDANFEIINNSKKNSYSIKYNLK